MKSHQRDKKLTNKSSLVMINIGFGQTVKFGLRGERVPRAEILAEFLSAHFQENPTKSAYFDELMIYFVSYVLGVAKENSENAISDHLETPNFRNFLNVLPSFPRNCHLRRKIPRAKIILYSLGIRQHKCPCG
jgi:hypothetical protein